MTTPALHARAWPWRALKPRLAVVEVGGRCGRFWKVLSPAWASGEEPRLPSALLIFPFPRAPPPMVLSGIRIVPVILQEGG